MTGHDFGLQGQTAIVTGAGGGIGSVLAQGLASCGAAVGCVDLPGPGLDEAVRLVIARGGRALALPVDVTDPEALETAVRTAEAALGKVSLGVNCAGVHSTAPAETMDRATWQNLLDVNLTGVFTSCQAQARAMLRGSGGSIVNIASIAATVAVRGLQQVHYNSSKAAVVQLSRSLALEWADRGIRVNALSPGFVKTTMSRGPRTTRTLADYLDSIPMRRMAEPTELVGPTVFLLSRAASYVTGTELVVDGGVLGW